MNGALYHKLSVLGLQFALISIENDKNGAKEEIIHWKDKAEKRKKKTHACIECDVNFKERHS